MSPAPAVTASGDRDTAIYQTACNISAPQYPDTSFRKAKPACDCGFAQRSFDGAVMITNVRSHSPVIGLRQFSHNPAKPKGGFFEWRAIKGARAKQPYAIAMKDGSPSC